MFGGEPKNPILQVLNSYVHKTHVKNLMCPLPFNHRCNVGVYYILRNQICNVSTINEETQLLKASLEK